MTIYEKLSAIQQKMKVPKNLRNTFGGYNYRNCETILEEFKKYESEFKVALVLEDDINTYGNHNYVRAVATLVDLESDQRIHASALAREAETKKGMDDSQITGACSSYARKYALNGLFLLDDTKDADTDEAKIESEARAKKNKKDKEETKAQEEDNRKTVEVEKQLISKTKAAALKKKLVSEGIEEATVIRLYNVDSLEELTEAKHTNILEHLKDIKAKQEEQK